MINENIIFLNDIKTYSIELLEYVKYNFINDEIIKEIVIYLESSLSEIDNINNYILELESKINELASALKKKRIEEYWKQHANEKIKLENELSDIKSKIQEYENEIKKVSETSIYLYS